MLTRIDVNNFSDKIEWLWNNVKTQTHAFDDTVKDNHKAFLLSLFRPDSEHFYNDSGMVSLTNIQPLMNANVHFLTWDKGLTINTVVEGGKMVFSWGFEKHSLSRITGTIPSHNKGAVRIATLLGMKFEGTMRECFLHNGKYLDLFIYGILRREFQEGANGRTN